MLYLHHQSTKGVTMEKLTYKGEIRGCKYYVDRYNTYYLFVSDAAWYYNQNTLSPILSIVTDRVRGFKGEFWRLEYNIL